LCCVGEKYSKSGLATEESLETQTVITLLTYYLQYIMHMWNLHFKSYFPYQEYKVCQLHKRNSILKLESISGSLAIIWKPELQKKAKTYQIIFFWCYFVAEFFSVMANESQCMPS